MARAQHLPTQALPRPLQAEGITQPPKLTREGTTHVSNMGMAYVINCSILYNDTTIDAITRDSLAAFTPCNTYNTLHYSRSSQCMGKSSLSDQTP